MSSSSSSSSSFASSSSSSSSDSDSSQSENDERVSVKDAARGLAEPAEENAKDDAYSESFEDDEDFKDEDDDDDDDEHEVGSEDDAKDSTSDADSSHHEEKEAEYPKEEEEAKWRELDSDEEPVKARQPPTKSKDGSSSSSKDDEPVKAHKAAEEAPLPRAASRASNSSSGSSSSYHALGSARGTTPSQTPVRNTGDHGAAVEESNVKSSPPRHPLSGVKPAFLNGSDDEDGDDHVGGTGGGGGGRSDVSEAHTSVSRGGDAPARPASASDATPSSRADGSKGEKAAQTPEARHRSTSVPEDRTELAAIWKENNDLRSKVEAAKAQLLKQKKQREKEARAAQRAKRAGSATSSHGTEYGTTDDMYDELVHEKRENRHLRREKERLDGLLVHFKKLQQRKQFIEKAKAEIAQLEQENKQMQSEIRTNARSLVSVTGKRSISRPQASGSAAATPTKSPATTPSRGAAGRGNTSGRSPAGRGTSTSRGGGGRGRGKSSARSPAQKRGVTGRSQPRSVAGARHSMDISSQEEEERRKLIKDMETQLILAKKSCDRAQEEHATATRRKVELAMRVDQLQNEMAERLAHDSDKKMPYQKASQLTALQEEAQSKDQEIEKLRKQLRRLKATTTTGRNASMDNSNAQDDVNTASETKYLTKRIKDMKREVERLKQRNANAPDSARSAQTATATPVVPKQQKKDATPVEKATPSKPSAAAEKPATATATAVSQPLPAHPHNGEGSSAAPNQPKTPDETLWLGSAEAEPEQKPVKSQNTPARVEEAEPSSAKGAAGGGSSGGGMDWLEIDETDKSAQKPSNAQHEGAVDYPAEAQAAPTRSSSSSGDGPLDIPVEESDNEEPPAAPPKPSEKAKAGGGLDWLGEDASAQHPQVYKTEGSLSMPQQPALEGEDDSIHGLHPQDGKHGTAKQPEPDPYRELSLSGEREAEHAQNAVHAKDASHATTSSSEDDDAGAHEVDDEDDDDDDGEEEEDDEDDEAELSKGDVAAAASEAPAKDDGGVPSWLDFDD